MLEYQSWGRYPTAHATVHRLMDRGEALPKTKAKLLPFGLGRSYGDVCLNNDHLLVSSEYLNHFISFDRERGLLTAESGTSLASILALIVPDGWFLPVTPGTKFVTLGGAIANDIHGKNHHASGTFGNHVTELWLRRSTGDEEYCSRTEGRELFLATIAGLGLTGFAREQVVGEHEQQVVELPISVEELYRGGKKSIQLQQTEYSPSGMPASTVRTFQVTIPPGIKDGGVIRLSGQPKDRGAGLARELRLRVRVQKHPVYEIDDYNLKVPLNISPWEAVLGGKVAVALPDSTISLTIPEGSQGGQLLRLRGKGIPKDSHERGDALVELNIVVPSNPSTEEKRLFTELKSKSTFDARR